MSVLSRSSTTVSSTVQARRESLADLGIAAGRGKAALFVEGEVVKTIQEGDIVEALVTLAEEIAEKKRREKEQAGNDQ